MTIGERLDRLTARHEALTESVEMLNAFMEQAHRQFREEMAKVMEGLARLVHVAEIHEHRIERPKGERSSCRRSA